MKLHTMCTNVCVSGQDHVSRTIMVAFYFLVKALLIVFYGSFYYILPV